MDKNILKNLDEKTLVILDTNTILNIYRYALLSSKKVLDFVNVNKEYVWIPYQVVEEFKRNKPKVLKPNYYKNLKKDIISKVDGKKVLY